MFFFFHRSLSLSLSLFLSLSFSLPRTCHGVFICCFMSSQVLNYWHASCACLHIVQCRLYNVNTGALSSYARSPKLHNLHVVAPSLELARKDKTQARLQEVRERKRGFPPRRGASLGSEGALGLEIWMGVREGPLPQQGCRGIFLKGALTYS